MFLYLTVSRKRKGLRRISMRTLRRGSNINRWRITWSSSNREGSEISCIWTAGEGWAVGRHSWSVAVHQLWGKGYPSETRIWCPKFTLVRWRYWGFEEKACLDLPHRRHLSTALPRPAHSIARSLGLTTLCHTLIVFHLLKRPWLFFTRPSRHPTWICLCEVLFLALLDLRYCPNARHTFTWPPNH